MKIQTNPKKQQPQKHNPPKIHHSQNIQTSLKFGYFGDIVRTLCQKFA